MAAAAGGAQGRGGGGSGGVARGSSGAAAAAAGRAHAAQLEGVLSQLRSMRDEVLAFWLRHGPDEQHGGFHGALARGGAPTGPGDKGIVQQARHAWAMSLAASRGLGPRGGGAAAAAAAKSAWGFIGQHMRRPDGTWRWAVSRDGARVVNDGTSLYGQWFAVYAAVQFHRAFGDAAALEAALKTFRATDARFHDAFNGGYDETDSTPPLHKVRLPGGGMPRTLNIFLHGTEALAALWGATRDAAVLARLLELLEIISTRLISDQGVLYEFYDPASWDPVGPPAINYGHNLESAWLVAVTCSALRDAGALPAATADLYTSRLAAAAARALDWGLDAVRGGVYEAGPPGAPLGEGGGEGAAGASTRKVWWVQCEAMLAMARLYQDGGAPARLADLARTLQFVHDHIRDPQDGEWVWQTDAAGAVVPPYSYAKGNAWKASYHNLRALIFLDDWLGRAAGGAQMAAAPAAGKAAAAAANPALAQAAAGSGNGG